MEKLSLFILNTSGNGTCHLGCHPAYSDAKQRLSDGSRSGSLTDEQVLEKIYEAITKAHENFGGPYTGASGLDLISDRSGWRDIFTNIY